MSAEFASPELLGPAPGWSPSYFAGATGVALRAGFTGQAISELGGQVLGGWCVNETPGALAYDSRATTTPVYRQAYIGRLRLQLGAKHWDPPPITGRWSMQPADVVLNKFAPVRAAFVSPNEKRPPRRRQRAHHSQTLAVGSRVRRAVSQPARLRAAAAVSSPACSGVSDSAR